MGVASFRFLKVGVAKQVSRCGFLKIIEEECVCVLDQYVSGCGLKGHCVSGRGLILVCVYCRVVICRQS